MNPSAQPTQQPVAPQPVIVTPDSQNSQPYTPPTSRFSKKMFGIIALIVVALAIPVTLLVLRQTQTITQQAATIPVDPNAIAVVATRNIYQADIDAFLGEENATADAAVKSKALETIIERQLIDNESQKLGLKVSDQEIIDELAKTGTQDFSSLRVPTKYEILKQKITSSQVKYIESDNVGFWLPPFDYHAKLPADKQAIVDRRRAQQKEILTEIHKKAEAGEDMLVVAKAAYEDFPLFQGILSINGRIITPTINDALLAEPYLYIVDDKNSGTETTNIMLAMKEGEAKIVEPANGAGGSVIKVITINEGSFSSYEEWLTDQKSRYVKIYKQL